MSPSPKSTYTQTLTNEVFTAPIHQTLNLSLTSQTPTPLPTALLSFTSSPIHLTSAQSLHGGISSLMIDAAGYLALIPTLSEGQSAATVASSYQVLNAVMGKGKKYEVEGWVVRRGRGIAFCEGVVRCEGVVCVRGALTKVIRGPRKMEDSKL